MSRVIVLLLVMMMALNHHTHANKGGRHYRPKDYLRAHNKARARVGVGPLVWNETLAEYARAYAAVRSQDCEMHHSECPYGENLAAGSWQVNAKEAVRMWVDEKHLYDVKDNLCQGEWSSCLHYTQVVRRGTHSVGCAHIPCPEDWTFVICNYDPPGNYIGERPF